MQGNHPALQLLRQRAAQNSLPYDRKDKFKLGLVVEGGGMRGAVSAGGLLELGNLGFRQVRKYTVLFSSIALQISWTCCRQSQSLIQHSMCRLKSGQQYFSVARVKAKCNMYHWRCYASSCTCSSLQPDQVLCFNIHPNPYTLNSECKSDVLPQGVF